MIQNERIDVSEKMHQNASVTIGILMLDSNINHMFVMHAMILA